MLNVSQDGLVVYGSLLAGGAALTAFVWRCTRFPAWRLRPGRSQRGAGSGHRPVGLLYEWLLLRRHQRSALGRFVSLGQHAPRRADRTRTNADRGDYGLPKMSDPAVIIRVEPIHPPSGPACARRAHHRDQRHHAGDGKGLPPTKDAELLVDLALLASGRRSVVCLTPLDKAGLDLEGLGPGISIRVAGDLAAKTWTLTGPVPGSQPTHPTQLYSFVESLLLCIFLLAYYPFRMRTARSGPDDDDPSDLAIDRDHSDRRAAGGSALLGAFRRTSACSSCRRDLPVDLYLHRARARIAWPVRRRRCARCRIQRPRVPFVRAGFTRVGWYAAH